MPIMYPSLKTQVKETRLKINTFIYNIIRVLLLNLPVDSYENTEHKIVTGIGPFLTVVIKTLGNIWRTKYAQ